jgi:hypothetical protein
MATDKIYAPVNAKEKVFQDGGNIINFGGKADKLIAFIEQHKNAKGYINLVMARRKTPGQYGDTHTVYLSTWTPKDEPADPPPQRSPENVSQEDGQSLPF